MGKTIQRPKKSKKSTNGVDNEVITNLGTNQNVVKVIIDMEDKEKPRRKKPRKKKVDKEKKEAIDELREALGEYDEEQTKAQKLGIKIPSELGMTSIKSDEIKTTDDILRFIKLIREKKAQIQALEQTKLEPERLNRFLTRDVPVRSGQFSPFIPLIEPQRQVEQQVRTLPSARPRAGPAQPTDFDAELRGLQESVSLPSTPDELGFEDFITKLQAGLRTIGNDIQGVLERGNGKLTLDQIRNFKSRYEQVRKKLETSFNKLPKKSQNKLQNVFSDFETSINEENEKLAVIERQSIPPLPPIPPAVPPAPPRQPRQLRRPLRPQPEAVVPESQGMSQPQEEEIDAEREADIQLLKKYVNQTPPPLNWSLRIRSALSRLGATQTQISDIGDKSKTADEKRNGVAGFLSETVGVSTLQVSLNQSFRDTLTQLDMEIGVVENAYRTATREANAAYLQSLQSKQGELTRAFDNLSSEGERYLARPLVDESVRNSQKLQLNILMANLERLIAKANANYTTASVAVLREYLGDIATAWSEVEHFYSNDLNELDRSAVKPEVDALEIRKLDIVDQMRQRVDV